MLKALKFCDTVMVRLVTACISGSVACTVLAQAKFPSKGAVTIGRGPLPLLIHYVDASGKAVQTDLRNLQFEPPPIDKSKELAALAKRPCSVGDVANIDSKLEGQALGADAAGIGRFVWAIKGQYTSDGRKWQFIGTATSKDDYYDFNKGRDGERAFWQEVATQLGATFPGKAFKVQIKGSLAVAAHGVCELSAAGEVIV
jgi:hypothetical protein